jgi:arginine N-succinyltransferase
MLVVRPSALGDVSGIESLIRDNEARISSLPRKRVKLTERVERSIRSFNGDEELAGSEFFLFVLEDSTTGELLGCSGIARNSDLRRPFYNYRLDELIHASEAFDVHTPVSILHLTHELTGSTVLCSFAVKPGLIGGPEFELMSRARLMFIRQFPNLFSDQLVVELQGVYGDEGQSAFWDSLGRNFFNMDFASAEYHVATKSRTLLAELMPPHPIYVSMLTEQAQAVIGKTDDRAKSSYKLLIDEGFETSSYIDIFDGGPVLCAQTSELKTIKNAQQKTVRCGAVNTGVRHMVANASIDSFRCVIAQLTDGMGHVVRLDDSVSQVLNVKDGDEVSYTLL